MITDILACSVEDLRSGSTAEEMDDTAVMLRLWSAIKTKEGRRTTLNLTRAIVAAQDGGGLR